MLSADIDNVAQIMLELEAHADAPSGALVSTVTKRTCMFQSADRLVHSQAPFPHRILRPRTAQSRTRPPAPRSAAGGPPTP